MSNYLGLNLGVRQIDLLKCGGFVDVPRIISYIKTRSYMGRGIEFKHKDSTIYEDRLSL